MDEKKIHKEVEDLLNDNVSTSETDDEEFEKLLQEFISSEVDEDDTATIDNDYKETAKAAPQTATNDNGNQYANLQEEESALMSAHDNFIGAITTIAQSNNLPVPAFKITADMLYPRYKPYLGTKFGYDTLAGWDVMIKAYPTRIMNINPGASDEELLSYAEKTTDETLQMAIISYVEVLIELESCEIAYEKRRLKAKKKKIEREVVEEHQRRKEQMDKYIAAIEAKQFPINAQRLITNYFRTSRKDAEGAFKVLTNNPATFAPIEVSKIKDRFFGMIKAKPEDGIRINRELGNFLKKLKV